MMTVMSSDETVDLHDKTNFLIKRHLVEIDAKVGVESWAASDDLLNQLRVARELYASSPDAVHDDIFILETYITFFRAYGRLWWEISKGNFSVSWGVLQDANDALRLIRKFSGLRLDYFSEQLSSLETLYPYNVFSSCGFVVERFECSICGNDIDSFECHHRKGELYRGQMAYGIAKNILDIDHIAFVDDPANKRCVITIPDTALGFSGVRYLGNALNQDRISVSTFGSVVWNKIAAPNPGYTRLGRNEPCYCNSGKKFKRCCIGKKFIESDHAEILPVRSIFERSGLS